MLPWRLVRPLFFMMDPERAHELALTALANPLLRPFAAPLRRIPDDPIRLWGLTFRNRLGLAGGFDKNAVALPAWERLGFGFVEVGTVTRYAQPGNPRPRVFRVPEHQALVNRMGFPNDGPAVVREHILNARRHALPEDFPIGVNIGKNKATPNRRAADDYVAVLRTLFDAGDYFVINVSSPNTPGLRKLQSPDELDPILAELQAVNRELGGKPLLLKIAPDLDDAEIAAVLRSVQIHDLSGVIATNTTIDHGGMVTEEGGLSGRPLARRSTDVIRFITRETGGRLPIIGVGGVFTREDYLEKLDAGASLVQIYTGFVYGGPRTLSRILRTT